jgi:putative DNA primase/helicase
MITEQFKAAIKEAGIEPPVEIIADGKIHRFSSNGKKGDLAGWYVFHPDDPAAGQFGCWRSGISQTWHSKSKDEMTPYERAELKRKIEESGRVEMATRKKYQDEAAETARRTWPRFQPAKEDHPYLQRKGIEPHIAKARAGDNALVVPVTSARADGRGVEYIGLQYILPHKDETGRDKYFMPGTVKKGGFCLIAGSLNNSDQLAICEGFSTAATIHEATGLPTFAAFDCGNLEPAAKAISKLRPKASIVIAGDNDQWKGETNPGRDAAELAAMAVNGSWIVPDFSGLDTSSKPTDFNDLATIAGLEVVKMQIDGVVKTDSADRVKKVWTKPVFKKITDISRIVGVLSTLPPLEYERYREPISKKFEVRVTALDDAVKKQRIETAGKEQVFNRQKRIITDKNPSQSSQSSAYDSQTTNNRLTDEPALLTPGSLLVENEEGKLSRLIDSKAAENVSQALKGTVAWDARAASWLLWSDTHWEPLTQSAKAEKIIADAVTLGTDTLGFRPSYLNGITQIITKRDLLPIPKQPEAVVPFANGLLCLRTRKLTPAAPDHALDWCLPHSYHPAADCPTIKAWLRQCVDGDNDTVQLLRAWLAALILEIPLQMFLVFIGPGGSGKSTFEDLASALVGLRNMAISTLRDLEENRFEPAKLYGKRLARINEAGRHGGSLDMLKAVTGGDPVPIERKHVQQAGSFVFRGLVLMATNEDIKSTDNTSGLERRRIMVQFDRRVTPEEKAGWAAKGGPEKVLHSEIPGLINWCLELSPNDIRQAFDKLPRRVMAANLLGMRAGNSVADWLMDNCVPEKGAWTQIGVKKEIRDGGVTAYDHSHDWLYPNYLAWCVESGRNRPLASRSFRAATADIVRTLGHQVEDGKQGGTNKAGISGLRLRGEMEPHHDWLPVSVWREGCDSTVKPENSPEPAYVMDVSYNDQLYMEKTGERDIGYF